MQQWKLGYLTENSEFDINGLKLSLKMPNLQTPNKKKYVKARSLLPNN